jgi:hypothetical protein
MEQSMSAHARTAATPARKARSVPVRQNGAAGDLQTHADVAALARTCIEAQQAERHALIEQAAYFMAKQRGFETGHELDDWLAAEAKVDAEAPKI